MAEFAAAALASAAATAGTAATAAGSLASVSAGVGAASSAVLAGAGAAGGIGSLLSGLGSLGGLSTVGSILSGVATVGSVLNTQRAGDQAAKSYELNAQDAETSALIETNQGTERRTSLKAALIQAVGERDVATAASGTDLSFGTAALARREAIADSERALTVDQNTTDVRVARLRERAASLRQMGSQARGGALAKAAGIGITGLASQLERG